MKLMKKISRFKNKPLENLIFFVTSKCPLNCKHCFYRAELNKKINELSLNEIEKIAKNLPHLKHVQLSGGEPFVRKDLTQVIKIFQKYGVKKIGIPTNGFFTSLVVKKCKEIKKLGIDFSINVSIDGFKPLHNKIRGKPCFDKAIETFKQLKKLGIETGFNVSLSKLNYSSYLDLLKYLKSLNPDYINVIIVRAKPDIQITAEQFKKIKPEIESLTLKYKNKFYKTRQKMLNNIYLDILKGKTLPFQCLAGKIIAVLEPDGQVRSCEMRKKLGNARDYNYNINKILQKDNIPKNCTCIHSCFISPSMSYNLKWLTKNILYQYV